MIRSRFGDEGLLDCLRTRDCMGRWPLHRAALRHSDSSEVEFVRSMTGLFGAGVDKLGLSAGATWTERSVKVCLLGDGAATFVRTISGSEHAQSSMATVGVDTNMGKLTLELWDVAAQGAVFSGPLIAAIVFSNTFHTDPLSRWCHDALVEEPPIVWVTTHSDAKAAWVDRPIVRFTRADPFAPIRELVRVLLGDTVVMLSVADQPADLLAKAART